MSVLISSLSGDSSPARLLEEQLVQASPDLLRELLTTFVNNTLMSAEADAVCGAAYGTEDQRVAATEAAHAGEGQQERSTQD